MGVGVSLLLGNDADFIGLEEVLEAGGGIEEEFALGADADDAALEFAGGGVEADEVAGEGTALAEAMKEVIEALADLTDAGIDLLEEEREDFLAFPFAAAFEIEGGGGDFRREGAGVHIEADADDGGGADRLDEDAADFRTGDEDVIGPFHFGLDADFPEGFGDGEAGGEGEAWPEAAGFEGQEHEGEGEAFSGIAKPGGTAAAPSGGLGLGTEDVAVFRRVFLEPLVGRVRFLDPLQPP